METTYRYTQLPSQPVKIRLVKLLPSQSLSPTSTDPIRCEISCVSLFSSPPPSYHALSYCWGAAAPSSSASSSFSLTRCISIGSSRLAVTANLYAALFQLRRRIDSSGNEGGLMLWIDALCINQEDATEKNHQVAQMGEIYRRADRVISWLGEHENGSERAVAWVIDFGRRAAGMGLDESVDEAAIEHVLGQFERKEGVWGKSSFDIRMALKGSQRNVVMDAAAAVARDDNDGLEGKGETFAFLYELYCQLFCASFKSVRLGYVIRKLLWRDYWQRAWIVQEVYNARRVIFLCGANDIDENSLSASVRFLRILQSYRMGQTREPIFHETGSFKADAIFQIRRVGRIPGASLPLMFLLRHFRGLQSSLQVDRVYSLLSIATDADQLGIVPDYAAGARESLVQIAQTLLQNGYVEVLSLCGGARRRPVGLPSWVPDWGTSSEQKSLFQRHLRADLRDTELQPSFAAATALPLQSAFSAQRSALTVASIRLGNITRLGPFLFETQWWKGRWFEQLVYLFHEIGEAAGDFRKLRNNCFYNACATAVADQQKRKGYLRADPATLSQLSDFIMKAWPVLIQNEVSEIWPMRATATSRQADLPLLEDWESVLHERFSEYSQRLLAMGRNRVPMMVGEKFVGLAPRNAKLRDEVRLVAGAHVPYIFRKVAREEGGEEEGGEEEEEKKEEGKFQLLGEAYVHDVMDGEMAEMVKMDSSKLEVITVV